MEALSALTFLLEASNLYESDIQFRFKIIPGWLITVIHLTPMFGHLYLTYVFCGWYNYKLSSVSGALCITCAIVQILVIYAFLTPKKHLIAESVAILREVVSERSATSNESRQIYEKLENYNNNLAKYLFYFTIFIFVSFCVSCALQPVFYIIFGFPDVSAWMMPLPAATLVDATSYIGFYISIIDQCVIFLSYYLLYTAVSLLHIGFSSYLDAFAEDFSLLMTNVDKALKKNMKIRGVRPFEKGVKATLIDAVQRHIKIIRMMDNMRETLDASLFMMLMIFVLFISTCLLTLDEQLEKMDVNALLSCECLMTQGLLNTIFSYFSDNASVRLGEIGWITYDKLRWYEMTLDDRLFVQFIVRRADRLFTFTGAKIIPSSKETMAKLTRTACSCFILFRQFK